MSTPTVYKHSLPSCPTDFIPFRTGWYNSSSCIDDDDDDDDESDSKNKY